MRVYTLDHGPKDYDHDKTWRSCAVRIFIVEVQQYEIDFNIRFDDLVFRVKFSS